MNYGKYMNDKINIWHVYFIFSFSFLKRQHLCFNVCWHKLYAFIYIHIYIYIYILILKQLDVRLRRTAFRAARAMRCARSYSLLRDRGALLRTYWLCAILAARNLGYAQSQLRNFGCVQSRPYIVEIRNSKNYKEYKIWIM